MLIDQNNYISDFIHQMQLLADNQITGTKAAYIGYIATYNTSNGYVTVTNPLAGAPPTPAQAATQGGLQNGTPLISAPMPLATFCAGICTLGGTNLVNANVQYPGIQFAPQGGASIQNPTAGEQVLVINIANEIGYAACAFLMFNDVAQPPGQSIPVLGTVLQASEWLFVHPSGSTIYFKNNGDIDIFARYGGASTGNINVTANGGVGLTTVPVDGTIPTPPSQGDITLKAAHAVNLTSGTSDINVTAIEHAIIETAGLGIAQNAGLGISQIAGTNIVQTAVAGAITQAAATAITTTAGAAITVTAGGEIIIAGGADITMGTLVGNITIGAGSTININSDVGVTAGTTGSYWPLLTAALWNFITGHTHSGVMTGAGNTGSPNTPPTEGAPYQTTILTAN